MEKRFKYPRTLHLPTSPGVSSDDKVLKSLSAFEGQEVIVTEKMDGENTTLYKDGFHARSIDSKRHESRDHLSGVLYPIAHEIKEGYRICGENLYAKHSISYDSLNTYFMAFSVWNKEICLSWEDTEKELTRLGLASVPVLYKGIFDSAALDNLIKGLDQDTQEGLVIRVARQFTMEEFSNVVAKWVRKGHVQTDKHWMHQAVVKNKLKD